VPHRAVFFAVPSVFSARALHAWLALGGEVALLVHPRTARARRSPLPWIAPRWSLGAAIARHRIPTRAIARREELDAALPAADVAVSVGFPWKLPLATLAPLRHGGVNLHPALLPAFRGPRPITALCLAGEAERCGGVSLHEMDADFDTGPLIAQEPVPYAGDYGAWMLALARAHGRLMRPLVEHLEGRRAPVPQDDRGASFQRPPRPVLSPAQRAAEIERLCATLGTARRLRVELGGRRLGVRGWLGSGARTGAPPRVGRWSLEFDAADARVRLARWLPGTRRVRELRWLWRLAVSAAED
jgi:methionyl-tRNA formyltransferase